MRRRTWLQRSDGAHFVPCSPEKGAISRILPGESAGYGAGEQHGLPPDEEELSVICKQTRHSDRFDSARYARRSPSRRGYLRFREATGPGEHHSTVRFVSGAALEGRRSPPRRRNSLQSEERVCARNPARDSGGCGPPGAGPGRRRPAPRPCLPPFPGWPVARESHWPYDARARERTTIVRREGRT